MSDKTLSFDFEEMVGGRNGIGFEAEQRYLDLDCFKADWVKDGFVNENDDDETVCLKIFKLVKDASIISDL